MSGAADKTDELAVLLAATAAGDERAFARLYALSSPHLYALLGRMLKRRDWAEEALQDCYLRIWQKAESYEPLRGAPMAWLMTVARHRALDLLRMKRPEVSENEVAALPMLEFNPVDDPERRAAEREGLNLLQRCLQGLQPEQRQTLLLAYYEGYTHTELTRKFRAPLGTVKSWLRRGLQKLQECLGQ